MVFVGGTYQLGDWSTEIRDEDEQDVWSRACDLVPSLKVNIVSLFRYCVDLDMLISHNQGLSAEIRESININIK